VIADGGELTNTMDPRYLQDGPRKCWAVYTVECNDLASYRRGLLDSVYSREQCARQRADVINGEVASVGVIFGIDGRDYIVETGPVEVQWGFLASERKPSAEFSECTEHAACADPFCSGRKYRYILRYPTSALNDRACLFILANPSTATPEALDPTVTRAVDYAGRWGYGWCLVANVRAWREKNPKLVPADPEAIGPDNDDWILRATRGADLVVCGWGKLGGSRGKRVLDMIRRVGEAPHALKLNKDGSPAHPLYLRGDLIPFEIANEGNQCD
jgi:hypothetical protein